MFSICENSNANAGMAEKMWGHAPAGIYGHSALTGGYAGGEAEYARVPFADVGPIKIENDDLTDDQVLFLSDILPTGYMRAEVCEIQPGDVIAVWGAGPVGLFAIASARMLGAERVIAIDRFDHRLDKAREAGATDLVDYDQVDVPVVLKELTGGRGPDRSLTIKTGQTHVHRFLRPLLDHIQNGDIDPSFVVSHHLPLEQAPRATRCSSEALNRLRSLLWSPR